tara:strand:+ start:96 stop:635 length:540 start_codon:yes stop_codon:yes gene_type:complete
MPEFKREDRYLVIKRKDVAKLEDARGEVSDDYSAALRLSTQLPPRGFVVVEQDWPEYELVYALLKARVTGETNDPIVAAMTALTNQVDALKEALEGFCRTPILNTDEATVPAGGFDPENEAHRKQVVHTMSVCHERLHLARQLCDAVTEQYVPSFSDERDAEIEPDITKPPITSPKTDD